MHLLRKRHSYSAPLLSTQRVSSLVQICQTTVILLYIFKIISILIYFYLLNSDIGTGFNLDSTSKDSFRSSSEGEEEDEHEYHSYSEGDHSSDSSSSEELQLTVEQRLALIKKECNCSMATIAAFSKVLNDFGVKCAKDPRTICGTNVNIEMTKSFVHLGLEAGIVNHLT